MLRTHWGVDDTSHVIVSDGEIEAVFEKTYTILRAHIEAFLDALDSDPAALKAALDRIGPIAASS